MLPGSGLASHTRDACQHSGPAQTRETCIAPQLGVIEENVSDALVCLPPFPSRDKWFSIGFYFKPYLSRYLSIDILEPRFTFIIDI